MPVDLSSKIPLAEIQLFQRPFEARRCTRRERPVRAARVDDLPTMIYRFRPGKSAIIPRVLYRRPSQVVIVQLPVLSRLYRYRTTDPNWSRRTYGAFSLYILTIIPQKCPDCIHTLPPGLLTLSSRSALHWDTYSLKSPESFISVVEALEAT